MNDTIDIAGTLNNAIYTFIESYIVPAIIIFIIYIAFSVLLNKNSTK